MYQFFNYVTKEENVSEHKVNHVTQCIKFLEITRDLNVSNLVGNHGKKCIKLYLANQG